jgi:hypothetical protein
VCVRVCARVCVRVCVCVCVYLWWGLRTQDQHETNADDRCVGKVKRCLEKARHPGARGARPSQPRRKHTHTKGPRLHTDPQRERERQTHAHRDRYSLNPHCSSVSHAAWILYLLCPGEEVIHGICQHIRRCRSTHMEARPVPVCIGTQECVGVCVWICMQCVCKCVYVVCMHVCVLHVVYMCVCASVCVCVCRCVVIRRQ